MEKVIMFGGMALSLWAIFWICMLIVATMVAIVTSRSFLIITGLLLILLWSIK